jgi:hypothetical protein
MPESTDFVGGEYDVGLKIKISAQLEVDPPHISPLVLRGANGGGTG